MSKTQRLGIGLMAGAFLIPLLCIASWDQMEFWAVIVMALMFCIGHALFMGD